MIRNIGWPEIMVILLVGLLVVGPRKIPELARAIGQAIRSFKNGLKDIERDVEKNS